jgi:uncharacterized protein YdaU (DUF1376 family)
MAKDPAYLFYSDNFLSGTMFLTNEQTGKYIRLLCAQHLTGHLLEKDMLKICGSHDEDVWSKFEKDDEGKYYNVRLELEISKRKLFSESRSNNRKGKVSKKETSKKKKSLSHDEDMEDENEIGNRIKKRYGVNKNILLTDPEIERLKTEFPIEWQLAIDKLSNWGKEKAKSFKDLTDHNLTIRRWVIKAVREDLEKGVKPKAGTELKTDTEIANSFEGW